MLTNKRHFDKLQARCEQESYFDFTIHEVNELLEREKIDVVDEQDFSSGLFCYLASKKLSLNHYAQPKERKYFQHHRAGLVLAVLSVALLSIGIGITLTSVIKGWLYQDTINETTLIEQKFKAKFNQLSETQIDSTTSTASMQHIVQAVETLEGRYLRDPEEMLAMVSNDISIFSDIRVKKLDWFVSNISDSTGADQVVWGKPKKTRKRKTKKQDRNIPKPTKGYFEIVNVEGEFLNFDGNFRYALSAVDDLEKTMSESGKYFSVEITKRPLDIEPENRLSGDVGAGRNANQQRAEVGFRVVREVLQDG
jgi:hypothetical protein